MPDRCAKINAGGEVDGEPGTAEIAIGALHGTGDSLAMRFPIAVFALLQVCAAQAPQPTARSLFDGKTLDGWVTKGGRYDGPARWTVEAGCMVGRTTEKSEGGLIYTDRPYHSFELSFEVQMDYPFDSGVFLRMVPPSTGLKGLQITLDHRPGGEIGAIYADGFLAHNEQGAKAYEQGKWNRVRVRSTGRAPHVQAWVNDVQITDYTLPVDAQGYAETGRIGLQVHGGEPAKSAVRFRAITITELPVFDAAEFTLGEHGALTPKTAWDVLFDGRNLDAFAPHGGDGSGFAVRDGVLAALTKGEAHELRSKQDSRDFELRLDFKITSLANSGVFLRADRKDGNPAFSGAEVQILDDFNWEEQTKSKLKPWQFTGSLYGSVAPGHKDALYPLGSWNTLEVRFVGSRIRTRLNGATLYDVDTATLTPEQGEAFAKRVAEGFIGLQRHAPGAAIDTDAYAWFRNVFVQRLDVGKR